MKDSYKRYKIDKLIQMAKATSNDTLREELLAEANMELHDFSERHGDECTNYTETFINDCLEKDKSVRTQAKMVWETYKEYCECNNVAPIGKNTFYAYLANRGFFRLKGRYTEGLGSCRSNNDHYINVRIIKPTRNEGDKE